MKDSELRYLFKEGTLLRIEVIKEKGIKLTILGRVLQFDETRKIILVYEVDKKKVEILRLNEIEDIHETA